MAAGVLEFNDDNFETDVLKSALPVLVDFWAPWCGPCKMIAPVIEQVANETGGRFRVGKLNIDNSPKTPMKYGINSIPSLLVFKGGEIKSQFLGAGVRKDALVKALENAV